MIHEISDGELKKTLSSVIAGYELPRIDEKVYNDPRNFRASESDFQTLKVQFRALGLIVRSEKPRSVKDTDTYWTLTPYGDQLMTRMRAIKRKKNG